MKHFLFRIKKRLLFRRFLHRAKRRDVLIDKHCDSAINVSFEGNNGVPKGCNFCGDISVGYGTTLGNYNYLFGAIQIGRYCQFGAQVAIYAGNHPVTFLSTYINYRLFHGELKQNKSAGRVCIGSDVWIGHGSILLQNVTVGDGAIIGAGSVVTHDVPPFAVVAGNPAKIIKYRFTESIQEDIIQMGWWNKSPEELLSLKPLFFRDLAGLSTMK